MLHANYALAKRIADMRVEEALRWAETHRLLREAGIDQRGWLSRQACWLLGQLGHLLVALGRRLERYGLSRDPAQFRAEARQARGV